MRGDGLRALDFLLVTLAVGDAQGEHVLRAEALDRQGQKRAGIHATAAEHERLLRVLAAHLAVLVARCRVLAQRPVHAQVLTRVGGRSRERGRTPVLRKCPSLHAPLDIGPNDLVQLHLGGCPGHWFSCMNSTMRTGSMSQSTGSSTPARAPADRAAGQLPARGKSPCPHTNFTVSRVSSRRKFAGSICCSMPLDGSFQSAVKESTPGAASPIRARNAASSPQVGGAVRLDLHAQAAVARAGFAQQQLHQLRQQRLQHRAAAGERHAFHTGLPHPRRQLLGGFVLRRGTRNVCPMVSQ